MAIWMLIGQYIMIEDGSHSRIRLPLVFIVVVHGAEPTPRCFHLSYDAISQNLYTQLVSEDRSLSSKE